MREITVAAAHIAQGNVEQYVQYQGDDEIGALAAAFRELIQYFRTIASAADAISRGDLTVHLQARSAQDILSHSFTRMVGTLRQMSSQMQESTHILTEAIGSIVSSMHQLAATTTETATSVAQTATTVEEVKQTALVSNNKAQEMSEESRQTLEASQQGARSVEEVISGMNHTREQLESIAQRVTELGTQTQTIGDILATVSDLAERSHLLAINASIEAVKAGDAGKGFAVIAQETRGLADQSKQATAQVQRMLTDIRQATETAVFATREGAHSATLGAQRSLLAGDSIHTLTQNLTDSTQAMSQIAASSQQQLIGMDQVATAMATIRQASAQNAAGIQQIQTVTKNLQTVGQTLTALVEQFMLT
jgi:methyl-accepting chemotaxis protein